mmetsp:Transcript_13512/g.45069  ORF Transcript_13512/g.45069 Transcript_13512/m.45069 type:complete len:158 (+) Transcript_13512:67-540(+)
MKFVLCLAALAAAFEPAARGGLSRRRTVANLFGGVPAPKAPAPAAGGGGSMNIPGLGQISEEEMKLAMEFRTKLAERMAATVVEGSAMGGKVKVTYDGQGQPVKVDISDDALKEGEAAVGAAVTDAAKKAQTESLGKAKQLMMQMQGEIAAQLKGEA